MAYLITAVAAVNMREYFNAPGQEYLDVAGSKAGKYQEVR